MQTICKHANYEYIAKILFSELGDMCVDYWYPLIDKKIKAWKKQTNKQTHRPVRCMSNHHYCQIAEGLKTASNNEIYSFVGKN